MKKHIMKLHPFEEVVRAAKQWADGGHNVYQQFNCAKCGAKQTVDVPNQFFTLGQCEECGYVTNIEQDGTNYMLHAKL